MLVNGLARVAAISGGLQEQTETRVKEVSRVFGLWSVTGLGENCDRVFQYATATVPSSYGNRNFRTSTLANIIIPYVKT